MTERNESARVRVMGLAYAARSQRLRPWGSGMDLVLCASHRTGVTCCHFISSYSTKSIYFVGILAFLVHHQRRT